MFVHEAFHASRKVTTAPRWSQIARRWPKLARHRVSSRRRGAKRRRGATFHNGCAIWPPHAMTRGCPKVTPGRPKAAPIYPQDAPTRPKYNVKTAPRGRRMTPRWFRKPAKNGGFRMFSYMGHFTPQDEHDGPKMAQVGAELFIPQSGVDLRGKSGPKA